MAARNQMMQRILDDVERYNGRRQVARASIIDKLLVKKVSPDKLHPNPDDEFSQIKIGPNESIIERYNQLARRSMAMNQPVYDEPIIVQKLANVDGYLILNGHHRWAGAVKAMVPKVRITIVNY